MPFVGFILIAMGLFAVGGTLYMVMREHQETDEWYIPPSTADSAAAIPTAKTEAPVEPPPTTSAINTPIPVPPATANPDIAPAADTPADKTE